MSVQYKVVLQPEPESEQLRVTFTLWLAQFPNVYAPPPFKTAVAFVVGGVESVCIIIVLLFADSEFPSVSLLL